MGRTRLRSRRDVLRLAGGLAAGTLLGGGAARAARRPVARTLVLHAVHTGERLSVEYFANGCYQPDALSAVSRLLRDHHTDQVRAIDPALLDQLHRLRLALGRAGSVHVVCGYRSPETNARERRRHGGVARHSLHVEGRAVDVFVPGRPLADLHTAARALRAGGVGYYPRDGFVHLDTGAVRSW